MFGETAQLAAELNLKGNFVNAAKSAERAISGLDKATSRTQKSLNRVGDQFGAAAGKAAHYAKYGLLAVAGAAVAALKVSGDFEAQLNTINTIAFKDAAGLRQIGDGIRKIAKDTGLSLSDLTASYYDLLSAGVKTRDAQEVLNDAVKLGIGGLATTAEAVDLLTTAYNAYGLDAKSAAVATDQFAQAVADGKVKASEIAASFADVASVAKTYKVGIDQIAASYAFLTAQGVPASEVTTQMQRAIISLIAPSAALATAQKKLKINFEEEIAKKGLVPALAELRAYADANHIPLIDLLGRIEAVKYTLATTGPNAKGFATELDHIRNSSGEAAKQMAERQKGLNFELSRFKALAKDAGITVGNVLLPKVTSLVGALNRKIAGGQGGISAFANSVGEGFDKVVAKAKEVGAVLERVNFANLGSELSSAFTKIGAAAEKVDFQAIGQGLAITGRAAKVAVDAFMSLPPGLQSVVVAALAVNKLGGGIVSAGIKDLVGLALGSLKTITAANVTVIGANVVGGGVPGAVGAAEGAAGRLSVMGALKGALKIALPVGIALAFDEFLADWAHDHANQTPEQIDAHHDSQRRDRNPFDSSAAPGTPRGARDLADADLAAARAAAVFADGSYDAAEKIKGAASDVAGGLTQAATAANAAYRQLVADRATAEKARGKTGRVSFLGAGTKAEQIAEANYLANRFAHSNAPFYRSTANAAKTLKELEALQVRFHKQTGHDSAALARDILLVKGAINALKSTTAHKSDQVKVETTKSGQRVALAVRKKNLSVAVTTNVLAKTVIDGRQYSSELSRTTNYSGAR